jgi:hypothetical protein
MNKKKSQPLVNNEFSSMAVNVNKKDINRRRGTVVYNFPLPLSLLKLTEDKNKKRKKIPILMKILL